jgi:predicted HAD superfamily Cof-like phosphohydrolase
MSHLAYPEDLQAGFTETLGDPLLADNGGAAPGAPNLFTGDNSTEPMVSPSLFQGLDYAFLLVRRFHEAFGHPVADRPTLMEFARAEIRAKWMREEIDEFLDPDKQTVVDQCDAMIDLIYFALGTLVEIGVLPQSLLDIVHFDGNMSKMHMIDGVATVVKNADGKVVKPEGWVAPEPKLAAEVHRQAKHGLLLGITA